MNKTVMVEFTIEHFKTAIEAMENDKKHCENCKHLIVWCGIDHAECDCTSMIFREKEVDPMGTRCNLWEGEEDGKGE